MKIKLNILTFCLIFGRFNINVLSEATKLTDAATNDMNKNKPIDWCHVCRYQKLLRKDDSNSNYFCMYPLYYLDRNIRQICPAGTSSGCFKMYAEVPHFEMIMERGCYTGQLKPGVYKLNSFKTNISYGEPPFDLRLILQEIEKKNFTQFLYVKPIKVKGKKNQPVAEAPENLVLELKNDENNGIYVPDFMTPLSKVWLNICNDRSGCNDPDEARPMTWDQVDKSHRNYYMHYKIGIGDKTFSLKNKRSSGVSLFPRAGSWYWRQVWFCFWLRVLQSQTNHNNYYSTYY